MNSASSNLSELPLLSLLRLHGRIMDELIKRGVVRSRNNPVADYTEWLVPEALGLRLETKSRKGFDALDPRTGMRYQVKGRQLSPKNKSRQLGVIRDIDEHNFDKLVGVVFGPDFTVKEAYRMSHRTAKKNSKYNEHQRGHILLLDTTVVSDPAVEDITNLIGSYEKKVHAKVLERKPGPS
jgi:hypothetical protein